MTTGHSIPKPLDWDLKQWIPGIGDHDFKKPGRHDDDDGHKKHGRHDDDDGHSKKYAHKDEDCDGDGPKNGHPSKDICKPDPCQDPCKPDPCNGQPASTGNFAFNDADVSDLHGVLASMPLTQAVDVAIDQLGGADIPSDTMAFEGSDMQDNSLT
jgi:hypothetical protein